MLSGADQDAGMHVQGWGCSPLQPEEPEIVFAKHSCWWLQKENLHLIFCPLTVCAAWLCVPSAPGEAQPGQG